MVSQESLFRIAFRILIIPLSVFIIHIFLMLSVNIYAIAPWADMPMHALGGAAIAISAERLLQILREKSVIAAMPRWLEAVFAVGLVALMAVLWECYEFLGDLFFHTMMQPSLANTMQDLSLGVFGGAAAAIFFAFKARS